MYKKKQKSKFHVTRHLQDIKLSLQRSADGNLPSPSGKLGCTLQFAEQKIIEALTSVFWSDFQTAHPTGRCRSRHYLKRVHQTVIVAKVVANDPKGRRNWNNTRYRFSRLRAILPGERWFSKGFPAAQPLFNPSGS